MEGHAHVHGANLGIRASRWRNVGGFRDLRIHEDVELVSRVRAHTRRWVATVTIRIRTSGRSGSRVTGRFADYLGACDRGAQ